MNTRSMHSTLAVLVLACGAFAPGAAGQTFTRLSPASGSHPLAFGISKSGAWVAGASIFDESASPATVWSSAGVRTPLQMHGFVNIAQGISDDGGVIAGQADGQIVIWRDAAHGGDVLLLGAGLATGVSADGSAVVGQAYVGDFTVAFVYDERGRVPLHVVPGFYSSFATAINGPGTLITGQCNPMNGEPPTSTDAVACVWPVDAGLPTQLFGPAGYNITCANDLSDDGSVVVGYYAFSQPTFPEPWPGAVVWKDGVPIELVPGVPGEDQISEATAVSADGAIVVGRITHGPFMGAFIWDEANGLRSIRDVLEAAGLDMTDLALSSAYDISGDGKTIVGLGFDDATATTFAWKATIPRECTVDLNEDGVVDFGDYLEFLNLFDAGDLRVDFSGDGVIDFGDYLEFLNLFDAGC